MNECLTREEFIITLKKELQNIDPIELEEVLRYYNEYFDDAQELGEDNLQKVLKELGSPKKIVTRLGKILPLKTYLMTRKRGAILKMLLLLFLEFSRFR